jgi:hypothetical protein
LYHPDFSSKTVNLSPSLTLANSFELVEGSDLTLNQPSGVPLMTTEISLAALVAFGVTVAWGGPVTLGVPVAFGVGEALVLLVGTGVSKVGVGVATLDSPDSWANLEFKINL